MPDIILPDTLAAPGDVVQVDSTCYEIYDYVATPITHNQIEALFSTCQDCLDVVPIDTSECSDSIPCVPDLPGRVNVYIPSAGGSCAEFSGGSFTLTYVGDIYEWGNPCLWQAITPGDGEILLQNWGGFWVITFLSPLCYDELYGAQPPCDPTGSYYGSEIPEAIITLP